jgi:5-methylcytosine-specific restriction endonuclease McrA
VGIRQRGGKATAADLRKSLGEPETCYLCGETLTWDNAWLDHILPIAQGGGHAVENLGWTHRNCNLVKGGLTVEELCALMQRILEYQHHKS